MLSKLLRTLTGGFLMGSADLVPGVSGGTIALILGIYERLVTAISEGSSALGRLVRFDLAGMRSHLKKVEWLFLTSLLAGILTAVVVLSSAIDYLLEHQPIVMSAGFFGLVVGSLVVAWRLMRTPTRTSWMIAGVVGLIFFLILGMRSETAVSDPGPLVFFGSGALAICAMILPGISGSLILVLLGMYEAVLDAVNDRDWMLLGVFILGAIIGLALFSQLLHWALEHHHDTVLAGLIGLMAGSLRILWPWPQGVDSSALEAPGEQIILAIGAGVVGFAVVFLISRLGSERVS